MVIRHALSCIIFPVLKINFSHLYFKFFRILSDIKSCSLYMHLLQVTTGFNYFNAEICEDLNVSKHLKYSNPCHNINIQYIQRWNYKWIWFKLPALLHSSGCTYCSCQNSDTIHGRSSYPYLFTISETEARLPPLALE